MRFAAALILSTSLLLAACSGTVAPSAEQSGTAPTTRIDVKLTDALRMEPASMTVPAGVPVTFVVTNAGAIEHEFYLGDEDAQAEHEQEMASGGMAHGDPAGIALMPGETKELTYTFVEAGMTIAGCHVTGHYGAGMLAQITVAE